MYKLFKIIFILPIIFICTGAYAKDDVSTIIKKAMTQLGCIQNYEADMIISRHDSLSKKLQKSIKAHVYFTTVAFRVEMTEPAGNIYLFKGNDKYELSGDINKSSSAKYVAPDFYSHEPVRSILFILSQADKASDRKITSDENNYRLFFKTIINRIEIVISKNDFLVKHMYSYIDSKQVTEVSLKYKKFGNCFLPVKKTATMFMNKKKIDTVVLLEGIKVNHVIDKQLFLAGE